MRPILPGARGPAVEDIQKRLLKLGYDLGPTGVDGVFLGKTRDAVTAFQSHLRIAEDGIVGDETWAALVDETFTLGDRSLYLRLPYFHGNDVSALQRALNTLGFACGTDDGIFGPSTEAAVREFQRNSGQPADGIAGPATITAVLNLRHVWEGKESASPFSTTPPPARLIDVLRAERVVLEPLGDIGREIAERFVNVALASASDARVSLGGSAAGERAGALVLLLDESGDAAPDGLPAVSIGHDATEALVRRLMTALAVVPADSRTIAIDLGGTSGAPEELQRVAVRLLDAVCHALA